MAAFEPQSSDSESDHYANRATALKSSFIKQVLSADRWNWQFGKAWAS